MGFLRQRATARYSILDGLVPRTLLLTSLTFACGSVAAQDHAFDFALIGDMPYTKVQEREYQRVLHMLNAADLAFVAHIGDFQFDARPYNQDPSRSAMPCVEDNYRAILSSFQSIRTRPSPVVADQLLDAESVLARQLGDFRAQRQKSLTSSRTATMASAQPRDLQAEQGVEHLDEARVADHGIAANTHPLDEQVRAFYARFPFQDLPGDPKRAMFVRMSELVAAGFAF